MAGFLEGPPAAAPADTIASPRRAGAVAPPPVAPGAVAPAPAPDFKRVSARMRSSNVATVQELAGGDSIAMGPIVVTVEALEPTGVGTSSSGVACTARIAAVAVFANEGFTIPGEGGLNACKASNADPPL